MVLIDILLFILSGLISVLLYKIRKHKEDSNTHKQDTKDRLSRLEQRVDDLITFLTKER